MKLLPITVLAFCGFLPQVVMGQNVAVVVGQQVDFGQRQPIATPQVGVPATPTASFATPAPTVGISNQGRAGISSNIELPEGVTSTLSPPELAYQNALGSVLETPAVAEQPAEETGSVDLGLSFFVGAGSSEKKAGISLGEVAAGYKAMARARNVRIYTNTD